MIESVLQRKNVKAGVRLTIKTALSAALIAVAVLLPQLVHLAAGAEGGMRWLPMYLPVLLGGCLLGWRWGLGVGILAPLVSFAVTSATGSPMPAAARLPYMMAELAVFAAVSGAFSSAVSKNAWMAFPAVLLASVSGRLFFLAVAAVFQSVSPLSAAAAWSQIQAGLPGLVLQAVIVPFVVMGIAALLNRNKK